MYQIVSIIFALLTIITLNSNNGYAVEKAASNQIYYTAYNIWKWPSHNMRCINYKGSDKWIPAGTKITNLEVVTIKEDGLPDRNVIRFKNIGENKTYSIYFHRRFHPGKTIFDYKDMMFTQKTFDELTEGLNEIEIRSIKEGLINDGMGKEAVLICYGPPAEHRTPTLEENVWVYWTNRNRMVFVVFDSENRTVKEKDKISGRPEGLETAESVEKKINMLKRLFDAGLITQEEYNKKKVELLDRL